jgi:hypothetical protein
VVAVVVQILLQGNKMVQQVALVVAVHLLVLQQLAMVVQELAVKVTLVERVM